MKYLLLFLVLATAAFAGDVKLPSGRILKNVVIGPMVSTKSSFPRTLALKYETSVDLRSRKAISDEVEEVWKDFRLEADKGKYEAAVVMVVAPAAGFPFVATTSEQINFVFEKKEGVWKMLPYPWTKDEKPNQAAQSTTTSVTPPAGQEARQP